MEESTSMSTEDYVDVRQIGKGAFGTAHIVQHKVNGAVYVLKRVRLARQTARERTASVRELHLLSNLRHRNVLQFHGCWIEGGCNLCTLVELCEAGDLAGQIRLRQPTGVHFSEEALQDMAVQLLSALAYLHSSRIAHRDLKTANILITGEGCLKLADFGLSTVLEPDPKSGGQLLTRTVVGTPHYMSPCVLQEKPYGTPNDIWALGCVLYEISALKPAFSAFNMAGLIRKVTTGPAPQLPSCYSESWRQLVRSCLAKEPTMRPSAEELLQLEWLQPAIRRVEERFGPALPADAPDCIEQLSDLPPSIMGLFGTFAAQERDEKRRAEEAREKRRAAAAKWDPIARAAAAAAATAAAAGKQPKLPPLKPHQARKPPPPPPRKPPPPPRPGVPPLVPAAAGRPGAVAPARGALPTRRRTHTGNTGTGDGAVDAGEAPPLRPPVPHPDAEGPPAESEAALRAVPAECSGLRITASRASHRPSSAPPDSPARRSRRGRGERSRPGGGGLGEQGSDAEEEEADHGFGPRPGPSSDGGDGDASARRRRDALYDAMFGSSDDSDGGRDGGGRGLGTSGRGSRNAGAAASAAQQRGTRQGSSGSAWGPMLNGSVAVSDAGAAAGGTERAQLKLERSSSGGGGPQSPARQSAPIAPPSYPGSRRPPLPVRTRTLDRTQSGTGNGVGGGGGSAAGSRNGTASGEAAAGRAPATTRVVARPTSGVVCMPSSRPPSAVSANGSRRSMASGAAASGAAAVSGRNTGSSSSTGPRPGSAAGGNRSCSGGVAAGSRPTSAAPGGRSCSGGTTAGSRPASAAQQPKVTSADRAQRAASGGSAARLQSGGGQQHAPQSTGSRANSR